MIIFILSALLVAFLIFGLPLIGAWFSGVH